MHHVILLPGIDALDDPRLRQQALQVPEIVANIKRSQSILDENGFECDLMATMQADNEASFNWYHRVMLCSFSAQIALFDRYVAQGHQVDEILSISLGDIPRSVCAGVASYERALLGLASFLSLTDEKVGQGTTLQIILPRPYEEMRKALAFEKYNVTISVDQCDTFFLLAGRMTDMQRWQQEVGEKLDITIRQPFSIDLALHHELMNSVADGLHGYIAESVDISKQRYPIFSSISACRIESQQALVDDMYQNICSSVRFKQSIAALMAQHEQVQFVSLGPAKTLLAFIRYLKLDKASYSSVDYFKQRWLEVSALEQVA